MKTITIRKGATRLTKDGERTELLILLPSEHTELLNWEAGEQLIAESNIKTGKLILGKAD